MAITRLSGGTTPANGSDPRTFPAIWNDAADDIEAAEAAITAIEANDFVTTARIDDGAVTAPKLATTAGAVMVFDDSAARGSAIPTPAEGMVTYLKDTNQVSAFNGSAFAPIGTILQVVSTAKTDTFSTTSTTHTDVTGLTATITPSSTSSKILVMATVNVSTGANDRYVSVQLARGGTGIFIGDADGAKTRAFASLQATTAAYFIAEGMVNFSPIFLDSPASTSALTYSVQARISNSDSTVFVNRTATDTNDARFVRGSSSMTVMEVAG